MIRVALVDDQELIRAGLRMTIDAAEDLVVVGEASSGDQAVDLVADTRADVVLMDVRMPGMDGIAATRALTDDDRFAGVKVVILTTFELDDYVIDAHPRRGQRVHLQEHRADRAGRRHPTRCRR